MDKKVLEQEKKYLENVFGAIEKTIADNRNVITQGQENILKLKKFFTGNFYDVDKAELANVNTQIEHEQTNVDSLKFENTRLEKQKRNPYFGRFDFQAKDENQASKFYIGLGMVQSEEKENLVYDWRADICSLYYDDKVGKTSYTCPAGEIEGNVSLKRQFKIDDGKLSYYIDSSMLIDDDILMETLSKNATSKMHDIVSTIQKEQNVLIRADDFNNTIVQGVAGSGKTSIAMHRVSYLLYKYRKQLKSEDILILSPSELFSDYLSEVLPSLGEEKSFTTTFQNMATHLLGESFQSREELLENMIEKHSQKDMENIAIKSSFEFADDLKSFLKNNICNLFVPKTMSFGDVVITKEEISDIFFNRLKNLTVNKRIDVLAEYVTDKFHVSTHFRPDLFKRAKKLLYDKFLTTDLLKIYNLFLQSNDLPEITTIGAYDIAPMLLIKENLLGLKNNFDAKYVIVDEMQDYTPCHFMLFDKLWTCGKLYLGDINQSIDRTLSKEYLSLLAKQTHSKVKFLNKSYRSTLQISLFSQKILGKHIANNVNRNGKQVQCIKTKDCAKAIEEYLNLLNSNQTVAIICKTKAEIRLLQKQSSIIKKFKKLEGERLKSKRIITTPAQAKGVEFDCVIVPFANDDNYVNQLDRNLLYVSSTRALHELCFVSDKKPSRYLTKKTTQLKTEN